MQQLSSTSLPGAVQQPLLLLDYSCQFGLLFFFFLGYFMVAYLELNSKAALNVMIFWQSVVVWLCAGFLTNNNTQQGRIRL